jgi:hypothetical protein
MLGKASSNDDMSGRVNDDMSGSSGIAESHELLALGSEDAASTDSCVDDRSGVLSSRCAPLGGTIGTI